MNRGLSPVIRDLARELVREPFVRQSDRLRANLEALSTAILSDPEKSGKSLVLFGLLLTELDLNGWETLPDITVWELAELSSVHELPSPFVTAVRFWEEQRMEDALSEIVRAKLSIHLSILAIEDKLRVILDSELESFWPRKMAAISHLWIHDTMELQPVLRDALSTMQRTTALTEEKLPWAALGHGVRYLGSIREWGRFHPSVFEWGALLLLFGQDEKIAGFTFHNSLNLRPVPSSQLWELGLRLLRLQQWKSKVSQASLEWENGWVNNAKQEIERINELLLSLEKTTELRQAA